MSDVFAELLAWCTFFASPRRFRRSQTYLLQHAGVKEVLLVGTVHQRHLTSSRYTLGDLENVVCEYRPECLLLEIRPEDLEDGRLNLAPIEMAHLVLFARSRGLPVRGIDWWSIAEAERRAEAGKPLELAGERRNSEMFHLIWNSLATCRRAVLFTGFSHTRALSRRLCAAGWIERPLCRAECVQLLSHTSASEFYPEMKASVAASIDYWGRYLKSYPYENAWSRRVRKKMRGLENLAARLNASA